MVWVHAAATVFVLLLALAALREARRARARLDRLDRQPAPPPPPPAAPPLPAAPLEDEALGRVLATEESARESLARRIAALEVRLGAEEERTTARSEAHAALAQLPEAVPEPEPTPVRRVTRALEAQGFAQIVLLPRQEEAAGYRVEAERSGVVFKGVAVIDAGNRLDFDLRPALRAFP